MHTVSELETSVPAFLGKLWKLVEDPETDDLICWAPNGRSFYIRNQAQFARELLPHYYKHNNMASFVRQLNMYGFHKKVSVELGGLKCDRDEMEFAHQYFIKGHPYLLEHIKRKIASSKSQDTTHPPLKPEVMNKVLSEVRTMRGRQEHLDSRLGAMKRENEALWRELAMLRRKHLKQQEIVNKLIHFLVTLVHPSRAGGLPVKRRYPLMIDNTNHGRNKQSKMSKPEASPTGPVIHELDASEPDLDSQYIVADIFDNNGTPSIQSPEHHQDSFETLEDENLETVEMIENAMYEPSEKCSINLQEIQPKIKPKGKKKRKRKVPVKILIPATENGEDAREETLLLDVIPDEDEPFPIALTENTIRTSKPVSKPASKPVPMKTLRSSKLAAMAANINKLEEGEDEVDLEVDTTENMDDVVPKGTDPGAVRLEDILIVPDDLTDDEENMENVDEPSEMINLKDITNGTGYKLIKGSQNYSKKLNVLEAEDCSSDDNEVPSGVHDAVDGDVGPTGPSGKDRASSNNVPSTAGSASKSKDLSLSCVNPSGVSDATYREEMDNHLETMQTELENLREVLRNEGYSIDANTLLGLFGADDPMSFGIPVNPELDPHSQRDRDEEDRSTDNSGNGNSGSELMAYNPTSSLLDFDDDIFLGMRTPGSNENTENGSYYNGDPLDLEDNKATLLETLVAANDVNNKIS